MPVDFHQWFTVRTNNKFDRSKSNFVRNLSNGHLLFSALDYPIPVDDPLPSVTHVGRRRADTGIII